MFRQDTSSASRQVATHKRRRDGAENDIEDSFDMDVWLVSQGNSERANLIKSNVIPLMSNYRGDHVDKIYQLFAEEGNINNCLRMKNLLMHLIDSYEDHSYVHDLLAIKKYFLCTAEFEKSLDALEAELQKYVARHTELNLPKDRSGKYYIPVCVDNCYKILSGYMYEWAKQSGFDSKAKLLGYMKPTDFLGLFTSKTIFKDSSPRIPSVHGMWSHAIQVWSVYYRQQQEKFLQHTPMEVYQALGNLGAEVWGGIFDRGPMEISFSSPGAVTRSLRGSGDQRPLLSRTIQHQFEKSNFLAHNLFDLAQLPTPYEKHLIKKHGDDFKKGYVKSPL